MKKTNKIVNVYTHMADIIFEIEQEWIMDGSLDECEYIFEIVRLK